MSPDSEPHAARELMLKLTGRTRIGQSLGAPLDERRRQIGDVVLHT
jgi:hypothetical protein